MPVGAIIEMAPDADGLPTDFAQRLRDRLGKAWSRAQTTMGENVRTQKQNYNRKIFGEPYKVGDRVWYFNMRKKKGECPKMKRRWLGRGGATNPRGAVKLVWRTSSQATGRLQEEAGVSMKGRNGLRNGL